MTNPNVEKWKKIANDCLGWHKPTKFVLEDMEKALEQAYSEGREEQRELDAKIAESLDLKKLFLAGNGDISGEIARLIREGK